MKTDNRARAIAIWIVLLPLGAILGLGYFLSPHRFDGLEATIARYLSTGDIDSGYADKIDRVSAIFVKDTRYENHVNSRQSPLPDHLNIYVLASDPRRRFREVKCNCAYIGHRVVLCDKKFLDTFAGSLAYSQVDSIPVLAKVNAGFSQVLFSWILGHEIGHAVLHDADGRFALSGRREQHGFGSSSGLWQTREREADEFAANRMAPTELRMAGFTLTNVVFQFYHRAYAEQHSTTANSKWNWLKTSRAIRPFIQKRSTTGPNVVTIEPVDGIHDPWVFRALRMASVVEQRSPSDQRGDPTFLSGLSANFAIAKGGFDAGGFCDGLPLRRD